jgi:AbrB family looped-hinge helix DNA binding protein
MSTVKISAKNQVVVPKDAREHLRVGPGDELLIVPKGGRLIVFPKPHDVVEALAGSGRGVYGPARTYLKRERESWNRKRTSRT